ncbi:MAG: RNA polymerase sigma factor [Chitinophagaceae bacterium]|nr:RNA polymerase sigma factor [Chitinophagaceae bacterium]
MTESELIQGLKEKDEKAFRHLVEQFQDQVYNTVLSIVQNPQDAEDVAQEVFIQVYRSVSSFKGESRLSTWIYRIATTRALDLLRSKKSKKRFGVLTRLFGNDNEPVFEPGDFNHPGVALDRKENAARLFKAISRLPDNQKAAFILHKMENLSYQEISDILQVSVPAVESLMHRAKANLRKWIAGQTD